jgi:DNA-binding phage protein
MAKRIERVFRDRKLTGEEIARDREVRQKVMSEYPPATQSRQANGRLSQSLKDALRASDKSMYEIANTAGISQIVLSRFLAGERDIRMATADKLADALGLTLTAK